MSKYSLLDSRKTQIPIEKLSEQEHSDIKKAANYFMQRIPHREISNIVIKEESLESFDKSETSIESTATPKLAIIIFATRDLTSDNALAMLKLFFPTRYQLYFIADAKSLEKEEIQKLKNFPGFKKQKVFYIFRDDVPRSQSLQFVLKDLCEEVICFFTAKDIVKYSTFDDFFASETSNNPEILNSSLFSPDNGDRDHRLKEKLLQPDISALTGCCFRRDFLLSCLACSPPQSYWLGRYLLKKAAGNITELTSLPLYTKALPSPPIMIDICIFFRETAELLTQGLEQDTREDIDEILEKTYGYIKSIIYLHKLSTFRIALMASFSSYLLSLVSHKYTVEDFEALKSKFSGAFKYGSILKPESIHIIHSLLLENIVQEKENQIAVSETFYMQDLDEHFLSLLKKEFNVVYTIKPQYYDYHWFNCMVIRAQHQPCKIIVISNALHKYMTYGKYVLQLWHGMGLFKRISMNNKTYVCSAVVCSSKSCKFPWAKIFGVNKQFVYPLGQVQTDCLFNSKYIDEKRKKIRKELMIPESAQVVFFAPTFRHGDPKYYDFKIDIEELSTRLKERNIYVLTKKHHVFSHLEKHHIYSCNLYSSANGYFKLIEGESFVTLLAASDVFMTDYSSGIFYAALRNMPLVLYAPDHEEYSQGDNGFILNFPDEIPATMVSIPDADLLLDGIIKSYKLVGNSHYSAFKKKHISSCRGRSASDVCALLREFLKKNMNDSHQPVNNISVTQESRPCLLQRLATNIVQRRNWPLW